MKNKYKCVRCGYETDHKSSMFNHFYKKKRPCPMSNNTIELTQEIKQYILENHVYNLQPLVPANIPQRIGVSSTINNFHTVNNFISSLDTMSKLSKYIGYKNIDIIDFEDKIENKYENRVQRLDADAYKCGFELSSDDFLDIINEISTICNLDSFDEFNILYDNKINKLKLYERGMWEEMLLNSGVKKILVTVQSYYLNSYELYLVRNIHNPKHGSFKKQQCVELLTEYYKFIGAFEVPSCMKGMVDADIISGESDTSHALEDRYERLYKVTVDNLKKSDVNRKRRDVVDILKRNSIKNIDEMNKKVLELFNVDEGFKTTIIDNA
jgi:hypothetical protein